MPIVAAILSVVLGFIELVTGLRIILTFFNITGVGLVDLIYNWSEPFVRPFTRFVSEYSFGGFTVDWPAILAAIVYALIGGLLIRVLRGRSY